MLYSMNIKKDIICMNVNLNNVWMVMVAMLESVDSFEWRFRMLMQNEK
jgi:hypothetical protein